MRSMDAHEVRRRFLAFFEARGHTIVPSSSLVPQNDPTLLFVNAGMVQFKDVFTGRETRSYVRAASVQRCLRAGGKHNDLDNVGFTPRHHTLFEMLGNFSFGDYFKEEAIAWAWEFLTGSVDGGGLGLDPDRLCATVYSGEGEDAPADEEAYALWRRFLPEDRIYRCSAKDNFWMMGDTGPCGPCSEIHLCRTGPAPGDARTPGKGPAFEEDVYMELWNLVFMQYEKHPDGSMTKLPKPSVDTGAGLERLAAVVQGVDSNYETELLAPLVRLAKELAGRDPDAMGGPRDEAPFRVIADHARATAFLVADGVFPDRVGRSYVLRRILRRAIRHGTEVGLSEPFMHRVCAKVVEMFGDVYPELRERAATIETVVRGEEEAFRRTLDRGLARLRDAIARLPKDRRSFPPEVAADLYDTYGFPLDLTRVISAEHGLILDEAAAEEELRKRQAHGAEAELGAGRRVEDVYFGLRDRIEAPVRFTGYERTEDTGTVLAVIRKGVAVQSAGEGDEVEVVLDRTPFYAEAGGQVGDTGLFVAQGVMVKVTDTQRPLEGLVVHRGTVVQGRLSVGSQVRAKVDEARRCAIRRSHSATHLLHHALREVLGQHVVQKGSLVAPDRLRFDFSHGQPLTDEQRDEIERRVTAAVLENEPTQVEITSLEEARGRGAMMLFGEKYGERVRVVQVGRESVELCGGTHVERTGDIGPFGIVAEQAVAQGVRRIEARTGLAALAHVQEASRALRGLADRFRVRAPSDVVTRVDELFDELKAREREVADLRRRLATAGDGEGDVQEVAGVRLLARKVPVGDPKALRAAADELRNRLRSGVVVLGAETGDKATILVAVTRDLAGDRVHAGDVVRELARFVDGRGGGRPDMAQAGGTNAAGLSQALAAVPEVLGRHIADAKGP